MNHHVAVLRESHVKEILEIQNKIESIQADVNSFHSIIDLNKTAIDNSIFLHEESAAVLALENILKTSKPFSKNIIELKNIATNSKDDLLLTVIDSIPITLQSKGKYSYFLFLIIIIMFYIIIYYIIYFSLFCFLFFKYSRVTERFDYF